MNTVFQAAIKEAIALLGKISPKTVGDFFKHLSIHGQRVRRVAVAVAKAAPKAASRMPRR